MSTSLETTALASFADSFEGEPTVVARAPGRVELLGNHTDYNGGLVLAAAIDRFTVVVGRATESRIGRLHSLNMGGTDTIKLDASVPGDAGTWTRYGGVVWALGEAFGRPKRGFDLVIAGDVPLGAAGRVPPVSKRPWRAPRSARGFETEILTDEHRMTLAKTFAALENEFVGVASGLLDQFSSLFGRLDHALLLDCSTEEMNA